MKIKEEWVEILTRGVEDEFFFAAATTPKRRAREILALIAPLIASEVIDACVTCMEDQDTVFSARDVHREAKKRLGLSPEPPVA